MGNNPLVDLAIAIMPGGLPAAASVFLFASNQMGWGILCLILTYVIVLFLKEAAVGACSAFGLFGVVFILGSNPMGGVLCILAVVPAAILSLARNS